MPIFENRDYFDSIEGIQTMSNRNNNKYYCDSLENKKKYKNKYITNNYGDNENYTENNIEKFNKLSNIRKFHSNKLTKDEQIEFNLKEFIQSKLKKNFKNPNRPGHYRSYSTNLYNY